MSIGVPPSIAPSQDMAAALHLDSSPGINNRSAASSSVAEHTKMPQRSIPRHHLCRICTQILFAVVPMLTLSTTLLYLVYGKSGSIRSQDCSRYYLVNVHESHLLLVSSLSTITSVLLVGPIHSLSSYVCSWVILRHTNEGKPSHLPDCSELCCRTKLRDGRIRILLDSLKRWNNTHGNSQLLWTGSNIITVFLLW